MTTDEMAKIIVDAIEHSDLEGGSGYVDKDDLNWVCIDGNWDMIKVAETVLSALKQST